MMFPLVSVSPLKIMMLCIHGYRQNAQLFREKTGSFRKLLKNKVEFVFVSAPNKIPVNTDDGEHEGKDIKDIDERGWWFSREDKYFHAQEETNCCIGYEQSIEMIKNVLKEQGPFDGLFGFSQGASLVSLLCGLREQNPDGDLKFSFAIMVASFKSKSLQHQSLYEQKVTIPTLHVFGETDRVIPKSMSEELLENYTNCTILQHAGGHYVPSTSLEKKAYIQFIEQQAKVKELEN
ncbi:esterase OVCA2 isoform X2 [Octopus sinensis]|uniref:Esterase OVCA2 isoform X2 n=1 Tax=Octopus sinensis TaxID=2607531 RepID=A0A7E6F4U5_9MOLL|nr:esterase OVCA2 isoform X2 [Octopus sinensis]